ncbi:hypothetical protein CJ030_MR2G026846 [Morella rubra]|uniref:Uncharacterized protein n=1 Tax=Morella rubra TaxID=262757 RepID=A0A6A1WBU2_9ROSI|nr:hypothetical protein CJ030_MR2G026846 [Morella rubra]
MAKPQVDQQAVKTLGMPCSEARSIRALTPPRFEMLRAFVESKSGCEEEALIDFHGYFPGTSEALVEGSDSCHVFESG